MKAKDPSIPEHSHTYRWEYTPIFKELVGVKCSFSSFVLSPGGGRTRYCSDFVPMDAILEIVDKCTELYSVCNIVKQILEKS